jgi:RNA recognition motif-containing protein
VFRFIAVADDNFYPVSHADQVRDAQQPRARGVAKPRRTLFSAQPMPGLGAHRRLYAERQMKNIYVGNLDVTTTEDQVRDLFQPYGPVATITLVMDRDTGVPRGFAFVEITDDSKADAAIHALNGKALHEGRSIVVNEARAKDTADRDDATERRKQIRDPLETRSHRRHKY